MENRVTVEKTRGRSRVTEMVYKSPLKIFETASREQDGVRLVLSNHGGGMLQGDRVGLEILGKTGTCTVLGSQGNTHIYRNVSGRDSVFNVAGWVESGGAFAFFPQPSVLHREARYSQQVSWDLAAGARLIYSDWIQAGRSENGESFEFHSYRSEMKVTVDGKPVLFERFRCIPGVDMPLGPAAFYGFNHMITVYCLGLPFSVWQELGRPGNETLPNRVPTFAEAVSTGKPGPLYAAHPLRGGMGFVVRALAAKRGDLDSLVSAVEVLINRGL